MDRARSMHGSDGKYITGFGEDMGMGEMITVKIKK